MARKRRDVSDKRNPSRNIKIHDRDELLRRVMDERSGKRKNEKKSRRTEIREQVYSRRERTRTTERRDEKKDGKGS